MMVIIKYEQQQKKKMSWIWLIGLLISATRRPTEHRSLNATDCRHEQQPDWGGGGGHRPLVEYERQLMQIQPLTRSHAITI